MIEWNKWYDFELQEFMHLEVDMGLKQINFFKEFIHLL